MSFSLILEKTDKNDSFFTYIEKKIMKSRNFSCISERFMLSLRHKTDELWRLSIENNMWTEY